MRRLTAAGVLLGLVLSLTGCGDSDEATGGPHRVTTAESEVLATTRFRNFDAGTRTISTEINVDGQLVNLSGWVDYADGIGYGIVTGETTPTTLLRWKHSTVAIQTTFETVAPLPMPTTGWEARALDPSLSVLDATLKVILELGDDRPENPLLLRQQGATWLRTDTVADTPVTVYAAPASTEVSDGAVDPDASDLRVWVDDTGLMLRAEVRTTEGGSFAPVDFGDADGAEIGSWR